MTYGYEKDEDSDGSKSESDKDKQTNKSIFTDRIAKDLFNSRDKVDQRLLKLHKFAAGPTQKTDKLGFLGVKDLLFKSLTQNFKKKEPGLVKKDEKHGDKPKLLLNFASFRNTEP